LFYFIYYINLLGYDTGPSSVLPRITSPAVVLHVPGVMLTAWLLMQNDDVIKHCVLSALTEL